jgi:hypothetical protein
LRRLCSLPHPERRRAPANGRAGLRNHSPLRSCTGEGELGFWEALYATTRVLEFFITGRLPSKSGGTAYRRLHRRLLRPVFSNVVINNVTATTTSANERYVRCTVVFMFIMFCEYMFRCYLFPFILLFSTSSMFELHMVVAAVVMLNMLELIMKIVPNYPTRFSRICILASHSSFSTY